MKGHTDNESDAYHLLYYLYRSGLASGVPTRSSPQSISCLSFLEQMTTRSVVQIRYDMKMMREAQNNESEEQIEPFDYNTKYNDRTSVVPLDHRRSKLHDIRVALDKAAKEMALKTKKSNRGAGKGTTSKEAVAALKMGKAKQKKKGEVLLENALASVKTSLGITHQLSNVDPTVCPQAVIPLITLFYLGAICKELNG